MQAGLNKLMKGFQGQHSIYSIDHMICAIVVIYC